MNTKYIHTIVSLALMEDLGAGDITTNALVPKNHKSSADIVVKSDGIICGLEFARQSFLRLNPNTRFQALVRDGQKAKAGTVIVRVHGSTRTLLTGERVALNFLSYLSAIATKTRAFVDAVKGYKTIILDTRKTTPMLRELERYGMRCGGGVNHRFNLAEMAMIKDNHRAFAAGKMGMVQMVDAIKAKSKGLVELEVDNLKQLHEALHTKADIILLDNMTPAQTKKAVTLRNKAKSKVLLEASGGIDLKNVRQYAAAGVERISVGGLTHSRQALDISLEFHS